MTESVGHGRVYTHADWVVDCNTKKNEFFAPKRHKARMMAPNKRQRGLVERWQLVQAQQRKKASESTMITNITWVPQQQFSKSAIQFWGTQ